MAVEKIRVKGRVRFIHLGTVEHDGKAYTVDVYHSPVMNTGVRVEFRVGAGRKPGTGSFRSVTVCNMSEKSFQRLVEMLDGIRDHMVMRALD